MDKSFESPIDLVASLSSAFYYKTREIFSLDKRSLALFRVAMAWATIWDLANRARDLDTFYTDEGQMPRSLVLSHFTTDYWSSLHMCSGSLYFMIALWIVHGALAFCMLIGYRTRLVVPLVWYMQCSLQTRNIIVFHSGDNVHRMALLWGALLPLGDCFSVDSVLKQKEESKNGGSSSSSRPNPRTKYQHFSFAALCLTFQLLIMYWVAHRYKTAPEWREKGLAGWMALQLDFFRRPFGDFVVQFFTFNKYSTFAVLWWQRIGCFFFFSPIFTGPARMFGVLGFYCMHLTFFLTMRLGLFGWATVGAITGLIPGWFWDGIIFPFFDTKKRRDFKLYYKEGCSFCSTVAKVAATFFLMPFTEVLPMPETGDQRTKHHEEDERGSLASSEVVVDILKPRFQWKSNFIVAQDQYGRLHRNWDALVAIAEHSPLFWLWKYPFGLDRVKAFGNELIELFHDHSSLKDHSPKALRKPVVVPTKEEKMFQSMWWITKVIAHNALAVFLLYALFCTNAQAAGYPEWSTPPYLHTLTWTLHLPQNWGMFSPRPPDVNWWYNIHGELHNGTQVELFTYGGLHSLEPAPYTGLTKPPSTITAFKNHRWFKVFEVGLNSHRYADVLRLSFGRWLCREYNTIHKGGEALYKYEIIFVSEQLDMQKLDGSRLPMHSSPIWSHICYFKPGDKQN